MTPADSLGKRRATGMTTTDAFCLICSDRAQPTVGFPGTRVITGAGQKHCEEGRRSGVGYVFGRRAPTGEEPSDGREVTSIELLESQRVLGQSPEELGVRGDRSVVAHTLYSLANARALPDPRERAGERVGAPSATDT